MPRAPDGLYSLPSGTIVQTGDTLLTTQHNPAMQDIASALSASLDRDGNGGMRANLAMGGFKVTGAAAGVDPTDLATVAQLSQSSGGVPVGTIIDYAGATPPTGWLICGGQSVNRADYPALFTAIGVTYGSISGATFNLPDLRGRVAAGRDFDQGGTANRLTAMTPNATTVGATGGAQSVALTTAQLASHSHTMTGSTDSAGDHTHTVSTTDGLTGAPTSRPTTALATPTGSVSTSTAGAHTHTINATVNNAGSGEAHPNVQPTILMNKLIKAV